MSRSDADLKVKVKQANSLEWAVADDNRNEWMNE